MLPLSGIRRSQGLCSISMLIAVASVGTCKIVPCCLAIKVGLDERLKMATQENGRPTIQV
eukprot:5680175-Amphidinium_carterae.2